MTVTVEHYCNLERKRLINELDKTIEVHKEQLRYSKGKITNNEDVQFREKMIAKLEIIRVILTNFDCNNSINR